MRTELVLAISGFIQALSGWDQYGFGMCSYQGYISSN